MDGWKEGQVEIGQMDEWQVGQEGRRHDGQKRAGQGGGRQARRQLDQQQQVPRAAPPRRAGGHAHLVPVSRVLVPLRLLLHPLQVGLQEALELLAVIGFVLEGAAVVHHRVHPVHVDELWGGRRDPEDPAGSSLGLRALTPMQVSKEPGAA